MAHFYGAPPMAMMTVGAGTILIGKDAIGLHAAVGIDWALWSTGTGYLLVFGALFSITIGALILKKIVSFKV